MFHRAFSYGLVLSCSMTKPSKWPVHLAKTQISLCIHLVWSESSLSAWRKLGFFKLPTEHTATSDLSFCWFCHLAAQLCFNFSFVLSSIVIISPGEKGAGRFTGCLLVCPHFMVSRFLLLSVFPLVQEEDYDLWMIVALPGDLFIHLGLTDIQIDGQRDGKSDFKVC